MKYKTPFHVKDSVIYDANGEKVKLWGVNYYAPFNHNFYNIEELGKDHFAAIDEDIRHFKLMNIDFIRMHLYEREITDKDGNIVENQNMKVFDYLVEQCEKNGIYLMITPMVWWNTVKNQIIQDRYYAYWYIDSQDAFGFSNFYSCDGMLWNQDAIDCQKRYMEGLFSRKSRVSGKKLAEYSNVVVIELFNEPRHVAMWHIKEEPDPVKNMDHATYSMGKQRQKLIRLWEDFRNKHAKEKDEDNCFSLFRASILKNYFDNLFPIVDKYFGKNVIKAQISSYNGVPHQDLKEVIESSGVEAYTIGTYLNVNAFDAANTDTANHLEYAKKWFGIMEKGDYGKMAKISYEFDATATQNGYPLAAIAAMYAKNDVQMAAYFTYTPAAVAAWNPGWLVHFMSLEHTPSRAAGFAAAGEIFRSQNPGDKLTMEEEKWSGNDFSIERKNDFVYFKNDKIFRYSNSNEIELGDTSKFEIVSGRGTSKFASGSGNGFYHLEKQSESEWKLRIFPDQKYISAPERGKAYKIMSNRYVNCLREAAVSMLFEHELEFKLNSMRIIALNGKKVEDGRIKVRAGEYILTVEK